jgi:hypothetical protein
MARAQDATTVTGGGVDPYVQQSLAQNKQLADNRLITAMREQGATSRQKMAGKQGMEQQQLAGQQAMQRTAAEQAAEDKRMAAQIAGAREDRKHRETMENIRQSFEKEQAKLKRLEDLADQAHDDAGKEKVWKRQQALAALNNTLILQQQREMNKAMLSSLKLGKMKRTAHERTVTSLATKAEEDERTKKAYDDRVEGVRASASNDARFVYDPLVVEEPTKWDWIKVATGIRQPVEGKAEVSLPKSNISGVALGIAKDGGMGMSATSLLSGTVDDIRESIVKGNINFQDVRVAIGTLDGLKKAAEEKRAAAKEEKEKKYWKEQADRFSAQRNNISQLVGDPKQAPGSQYETVGKVVLMGIAPIEGLSTGAEINIMRKEYEPVENAVNRWMEDLSKPIDVQVPFAPPEGASPEYLELYNNTVLPAYRSAYPGIGGAEENLPFTVEKVR